MKTTNHQDPTGRRLPLSARLKTLAFYRLAPTLVALLLATVQEARGSGIHEAVKAGDLDTVLVLLKKQPEVVNDVTTDGSTPLHEAARSGELEIARALLVAGADVNPTTTLGYTPLKLATGYGKAEIAALLERNGGQVFEPPKMPLTRTHARVPLPQPRAEMPRYTARLRGDKELRIVNSSKSTVAVRVLSGNAGADLFVAPGSTRSVSVPAGSCELFYIFSHEPWVLYQGDDVYIDNSRHTRGKFIQIGADEGNYRITRVN